MNFIQKLMGRRQFLMAAGLTSACALTCKKLAGIIDRNSQPGVAMAAERAAVAKMKASANRCPHLLSPLRIRNVVLKNRIMHTPSPPHSMQGPENYPTDAYRNHYSNMAKNAAIVTVDMLFGTYPKTYDSNSPMIGPQHYSDSSWEDIPPVHNYIRRLIEDIHCEGALVNYIGQVGGGSGPAPAGGMPAPGGSESEGGGRGGQMPEGGGRGGQMPEGGMPQGGPQGEMPGPDGEIPGGSGRQGGPPQGGGGMPQGGGPPGQASVNIEDVVAQAKKAEEMGFDVYMVTGNNIEAMQAVRSETSLLVLVKAQVGGGMMMGPGGGGNTKKWPYDGSRYDWDFGDNAPGVSNVNRPSDDAVEQAVKLAKQVEGAADILWIRDGRHEHPNSFIQDREKPFNLYYAEAIKEAGVDIVVCPTAGFHFATQNDDFIGSGKTDMVGMTTPFFADPELVKKASEGRTDDITPCLMCHDCHGISRTKGPWYDSCNVNPKWATPMYKLKNIPKPTVSKKVAVVGGGPGGMKAAVTAAERGHKVTLYEKSDALGGLLRFTDHTQWKWTFKDFKDHLIHQVDKAGIEVKLRTAATPEMIKSKGYDTVLAATGAEPVISKMPGADSGNVFNIMTAYSNRKALGKNVVMIGAGRIGTEAAIGMAKDGHKVTVLTSGKDLIEEEVIGPHNMMNQILILEGHDNFSCVLGAMPKRISKGKVTYTDSEGKEKSLEADSVVIYAGLKPRMGEAENFFGSADQVLLLGDCTGKNGTIQKTIRSAFFTASQI